MICLLDDEIYISHRREIEDWYNDYSSTTKFSEASKGELRKRLQSLDNDLFDGAYSELLVFNALRTISTDIERDYSLEEGGKNIDYLVRYENARPTLVEVQTCTDTEQERNHTKWSEELNKQIESAFPKFSYCMNYRDALQKAPNSKSVKSALIDAARYAPCNSDECEIDLEPLCSIPATLRLNRKPVIAGRYGESRSGIDIPRYRQKARDILEEKFKKNREIILRSAYGYVVALCVTNSWLTAELLTEALFGDEVTRLNTGAPEKMWSDRESNGTFSCWNKENTEYNYKYVSGVLFCCDRWSRNDIIDHKWFWFENPFADNKSSLDFGKLPNIQNIGPKSFLPLSLCPWSKHPWA
jgi:hypothetical protein